jgi:hypothetical protein
MIVRDGTYGPSSAVTGGDDTSNNASAAVLVKLRSA